MLHSGRVRRAVSVVGVAILFLASGLDAVPVGAAAFPVLAEPEEVLARKLVSTDEGIEFARRVLGSRPPRLTPALENEVFNTLMLPENRALAEAFRERVAKAMRRFEDFADYIAAAAGTERWILPEEEEARLMGELAGRFLSLIPPAEGEAADVIRFADDGKPLPLTTSRVSVCQFYLMGGRKLALRRASVSDAARLPDPPAGYGFRRDAIDQLIDWELNANVRNFSESTREFALQIGSAPVESLVVMEGRTLSEGLRDLFMRGDRRVLWPKHPYNTSDVPYSDSEVVETWPARFTASRSLVVRDPVSGAVFSVKVPTDHPHRTELQRAKADLRGDVNFATYRSDAIERLDAGLPPQSRLTMLREVLAVSDLATNNGFVVRDLTPLQDGNYYFPALSIPTEGVKIAALNGREFRTFWGTAFAEALGRAKAQLLLRYGLQMETPNTQNVLIQLDRSMRPTGKIVLRDISDTDLVVPVAEAIGEHEALMTDPMLGAHPKKDIDLRTDNSMWFWNMKEFGADTPLTRNMIEIWSRKHDIAFVQEARALLGIPKGTVHGVLSVSGIQEYIGSAEGRAALARLHALPEAAGH